LWNLSLNHQKAVCAAAGTEAAPTAAADGL